MKRKSLLALTLVMALSLTACGGKSQPTPGPSGTAGTYTPGSYTGEGQGYGGTVTVELTVDANAITDVKITGDKETPTVGGAALDELAEQVKAKGANIDGVSGATLTSNAVKELPDAFLRRCVFHYIEFPDKELMADIVRVHYPDINEKLLTQVLEAFYKIRQLPQIKKKPSTSEIIDWIQALQHGGVDVGRIVKEVPYLGVLLKKNEDIDMLRRNWR